jgi:uncharacterized membrane protein YeaQ/YmgE (transglycosylase-associated protein family)
MTELGGFNKIAISTRDRPMFQIGQLLGLLTCGLLCGLVTQNFAKKRKEPELGTAGLIGCIVAAFVGSAIGMYWLLSAITAGAFMAYIQSKAKQ